jgi:hypothetical protein
MSPEARKILQVLKVKGSGEKNFVGFSDLGDAILWEAGSVKDEAVRQAITYLTQNDYIVAFNAGLGLTEKGRQAVFTQ